MHRIPGSQASPPKHGKRVAYLQHGLFDSSAGWVLMGPHQGLAYWLADLGYDVWLGNARGNRYSRHHRTLNPDGNSSNKSRFWNFSWHEIGVFDLPTMIDYITNVTGQKRMHYSGHSQGTTAFFVMTSVLPAYNDRIISMNALAPIAYMSHLKSPVVRLAVLSLDWMEAAAHLMGVNEVLQNSKLLRALGEKECRDSAPVQSMCSNILFLGAGFDSQQLNMSMLPVVLGQTPAGSSVRQVFHYGQLIRSGKFRQYDHGPFENLITYGSFSPPAYNLQNINAPVILHYGLNDWVDAVKDVLQLQRQLKNCKGAFAVKNKHFNHYDFLWAEDARNLVYKDVIEWMKKYE